MAPGLRRIPVILIVGIAGALWWMAGPYAPDQAAAGEPKATAPFPKFPPAAAYTATATVHVVRPGHTIPDEIYGVCEMPKDKLVRYGVPIVRWGGNRSSRYNWKLNVDNAGNDWFFKNGGRVVADPADGGWVRFAKGNRAVGAASYLTVPMLGFVSKDADSYAFSVKKYGPQQATEKGHPDVGNGVRKDGTRITGNDWRDTSVESGPEFIADGVRLVVRQVDDRTGTRYWVLDNEPMLWHETHRDVRPKPLGYDELWDRTVQYAEAIREGRPAGEDCRVLLLGLDRPLLLGRGRGRGQVPHAAGLQGDTGEMPLAEWFIQKCGEYKRQHGKPLIDVFDFHWYPQAQLDGRDAVPGDRDGSEVQPAPPAHDARPVGPGLRPGVVDPQHCATGKSTMVLRRVRAWIEKHNPDMKVCVGEYNFGGGDNITGALAQADVFGILARERGRPGIHLDAAGGDAGTGVGTVPQLRRPRRTVRRPAAPRRIEPR